MRFTLFSLMLVFLCTMTRASADELATLRERIDQLEATLEELTLQLADSVRARRQLEVQLAEAAAAAAAATASAASATAPPSMSAVTPTVADEVIEETAVSAPVSSGTDAAVPAMTEPPAVAESVYIRSADCDVAQALAGYDGKRKGNEALKAWLQADDHLTVCSTAQLRQIRGTVKWDWLGYEKPVLKLLDKELAAR